MPTIPFAKVLQPAMQVLKQLSTVQPKEAKLTIGLDIGSSTVKVLALGPRKGSGMRPIVAQNVVGLEAGQDVDASEAIRTAISPLQVPLRSVNLSVSGQWVIMRIVEMPTMKPAEMKQALPFEAQRYLPFNVQDVIIDGVVLGAADAHKSWVLIVACKKELIDRRVDWVKRAGLDVALIDVDAVALANALLAAGNGTAAHGTRAIMNVGAQQTNVVIFQGATPYLVRDIPWGGEKLSRAVGEQVGVDPESVKKELIQSATSPELQGAVKAASEALVTELQLSFDYFENRFGQPPDTVLVTGGLSQCAPFLEGLKTHLMRTVTPWSAVEGLSGQFTVAYGLALRSD